MTLEIGEWCSTDVLMPPMRPREMIKAASVMRALSAGGVMGDG